MTQPVPSRDRRREQTRGEILVKAWELAERDGIAALSLRELAREVGMQAPSLYTYFAGKPAIYDAMFIEGYRAFITARTDLTLNPDDPTETLTELAELFVAFCQESIARYQLMFTRAVPDWAPSPQAYAVSVNAYESFVDAFTKLGFVGERALDLWTALTSGLAAQQLANDPTGDRWRRLSRDIAQMYVHHLEKST